MAAFRQRLGYGFLGQFGLFSCRKRTDLHQVVPQADAKAMGFPRRQLSSRLVLSEAVLGRVSGLTDVDGSECAWLLRARARELDNVDAVS